MRGIILASASLMISILGTSALTGSASAQGLVCTPTGVQACIEEDCVPSTEDACAGLRIVCNALNVPRDGGQEIRKCLTGQ